MIKALNGVPMTAHFHNDFGMAALNTVRAMSHGATYAGVTANGIGERAGNTSIHQTVLILKELYGVEIPGFRYDLLRTLRKEIEKYSGIPVQAHEPIIGEGVFAHESGIHTAGILIHPAIYQFIREETVGGEQRFVFGKHSGVSAVEDVIKKNAKRLKAAGITATPELCAKVLNAAKIQREKKIRSYEKEIGQYYKNYNDLGISEEQLIEMVIKNKSL